MTKARNDGIAAFDEFGVVRVRKAANATGDRSNASGATKPEMKPAPATPIAEKKEELGTESWDPQWDEFVESSLAPEMLSGESCTGGEEHSARDSKL